MKRDTKVHEPNEPRSLRGNKDKRKKCPDCSGTGSKVDLYCWDTYDCPSCDGKGHL